MRTLCLFGMALVLLRVSFVSATEITIVTNDMPPYNYVQDGKMVGMATEVVQAVLKEAGVQAEITVYPWVRAYKMALEENNMLFSCIIRLPNRETLFKWIGTIAPRLTYLYKLKSRPDIILNMLEDAKAYTIGYVRDDAKVQYLKGKGFSIREVVTSEEQNIKKLEAGWIDLTPYDKLAFVYKVKELGWDLAAFEKAYFLEEISGETSMAFSTHTSDTLVDTFRKALETVKANGTYEEIIQKYVQ